MFIIFLGLLLNIFQSNVENQILEQANLYVNEIQSGNNVSEYSWALIEIYQATCSQSNSVQRFVNRTTAPLPKKLLSSIQCTDELPGQEFIELVHEYKLYGLTAYYLAFYRESSGYKEFEAGITDSLRYEIPINYLSLFKKISNKTSISIEDIPEENLELIIFAIFYSRNEYLYLTNEQQDYLLQRFYNEDSQHLKIERSIKIANISFFLYSLNRYAEFSRLHNEIISDTYYPNSYLRVRHTRALAWANRSIGRYDRDLEVQRNIIAPLVSYFNLKDDYDDSKMAEGVALFLLGKYIEARDVLENLYYDPTANVNQVDLMNNLSISYDRLGEKNKFIRYLLDAYEEAEKESDYEQRMTILNNLYNYYLDIGDHTTALSYLEIAGEIASQYDDEYQIAIINAITGMYFWKIENDINKGITQFKLAITQFNPDVNFDDFLRSYQTLADMYVEVDSLQHAEDLLKHTAEVASENSNQNAFIESNIGLLEIALYQNDITSAKNYQRIIELYSLSNLDFETLVKYNTLVALLQFKTNDQRIAYQNLRPVIDQVLDRARTSIDSQTGFWVQQDEYILAFNTFIDILISTGNEHEAIQTLDEIKTINDAALYNSPILRANRLTEEELARDQLLNTQIMNLRETFLNANDDDSRLQIKNQIDQLSAEREEILNKIRQDDVVEETSIWKVQQELKSDEQILHFTEVGDNLYITYLSNSDVRLRKLKFQTNEKLLFTSVADHIASSKTNLTELFEIYDFLGIESDLDFEKPSLIVIPDNFLYRIPLEILPISSPESATSYGSTDYLIEDFSIEYFASLKEYHTDIRQLTSSFQTQLSAFAISDFSDFEDSYLPTLPFATQEARTISNLLSTFERKNIYMESEATKSAFLEDISTSKIMHIATHSEVSEQDPLFSTIYLNDENAGTSINALFAYELFDQQLNNELIMLNSCSSGSGDYLQGSGIMGITRALRYAGAKSMALNLWAVNDKIAYEFAAVFYESLNNGSSKSEAMRDAKMSLLQNGNANPHYWGAFMLTGDPSPIAKRPNNAGLFFPILLLIIGSISIYLRRLYSI